MVLPEACARDFGEPGSDVSDHAERPDGPVRPPPLAEAARAARHDGGGRHVRDRRGPRAAVQHPAGPRRASADYRKIHLYDSFGYRESDRLAPGPSSRSLVDVGGFRVGLMTCYDLRFPELARALVDRGAEVLVVPAAWVAGPRKVDHWRTLLRARAIENTVFVVAAGQPGPRYTGHSMVVGPARRRARRGRRRRRRPPTVLRATPRRRRARRGTPHEPVAGQPPAVTSSHMSRVRPRRARGRGSRARPAARAPRLRRDRGRPAARR